LAVHPFSQFGQSCLVASLRRRQRTANQPSDLIKRQAAPYPGYDYLAQLQGQPAKAANGFPRVELVIDGGEPDFGGAGLAFSPSSSDCGPMSGVRRVPDNAV
jgi:hypothetical protein